MIQLRSIRMCVTAVLFLLAGGRLSAALGPKMEVRLPDEGLRLGKDARFEVIVSWEGRGDRYGDCRLDAPRLENGRMLGNEVETRVLLRDGQPRTEWRNAFRFRPERVGRGRIGPVEFSFREGTSSVAGQEPSTSPPAYLSSSSVDFQVSEGGWTVLHLEGLHLALFVGLSLGVVLLAFAVGSWRGRRRLRWELDERESSDDVTARQELFSEEELTRLRLEGDGRSYYALLREELIAALSAAFGLQRVKGWDDVAFLTELEGAGLEKTHIRSLRSFLEESTRVRFGGERPGGSRMEEALRRARSLVAAVGPSDGGANEA